MDDLLDRFYEDIEYAVKSKFREYYVKVSQVNSSFFVLIKLRRGKILCEKRKILFDSLERISEEIYYKYSDLSNRFEQEYFPYFKLVKSYDSYHFHFFCSKKDYGK